MSDTLPGPGIKPLVSLRAHPRIAACVVIAVVLLGMPLAWVKGTARYHAEATVQVAPRFMKNLSEDQELVFESNSQYRQFVQQQVQTVRRYDIVQRALAAPAVRALWSRPGEPDRHAIERLQTALVVQPVPDTYLIRIALDGTKPAGLAEIVNAVTQAYLDTAHDEQLYAADERTVTLKQREDELLSQITTLSANRDAIARDLNLTSFADNVTNPFDKLIADQRHALEDAMQQRIAADAALDAFRKRGDTGINVRSVLENVLNDPGLNSLKSNLYKREGDLTTQMSGLRPDHPAYTAARQELAEITQTVNTQDARVEARVRSNVDARLAGTADQAHQVETGLARELTALEARSADYARLFQQAHTLTGDIDRARKELDQIRDRADFLRMESGAPGFVRGVSKALPAVEPYGPGRKKMMLMALLAAVALGAIVPLAVDLADRRVRTVNVAQSLMGIPPAGWQIDRRDSASHLFALDQDRRLASALMRFNGRNGKSVFGFTGVKPSAGTTTLLLGVADALRQLGSRVLIVEANAFRPDARFGGAPAGLADVLAGRAPRDAAVTTDGALPPHVAFCRHTATAHDGASSEGLTRLDRLAECLAAWAADYDFVLVDMPPLLVSADTELLLSRIAHVMVVLEAGATTRGEVARARRMLQTIDPDAVGFVLNRVRPFNGGGYLRENLVEFLTRRKHRDVMTAGQWQLWLGRMQVLLLRKLRAR
ncbi:cellulose synthase operon protein YhjQ/BcsQ [Burkholderia sp. BCC1644]|uniref:GumC family protein n=1 Tax=Burkholderia sp. BCC1644 TaxID=2676293 RepID=UPI00159245C7|nr:cellulose synthase operon protein YhjQ/BcsQ [Burkholderia sp. BCC1644]